jgi:hypothetical protein
MSNLHDVLFIFYSERMNYCSSASAPHWSQFDNKVTEGDISLVEYVEDTFPGKNSAIDTKAKTVIKQLKLSISWATASW